MPAHKDEHGPIVDSRQTSGSVRTYLKEGRVQLSTSLQTQERYLFLFNDLLLVAKEKGVNSYKLKEKIRLCEVWIRSGGVEEVSE
uniref:ARHGAP20 PH domain-containing protein n=1 Tax=Plectus sambesii TaxID=2011161 RepID=A0A914VRR5_9BILA